MKSQEDIIPFPADHARQVEVAQFSKPLVRGAADAFFRQWKWVAVLWGLASIAAIVYLSVVPRQYESEMTFLVKNLRSDPTLSADSGAAPMRQSDVTDAQIATEIQMLSSRELVEAILPSASFTASSPVARERAVAKLQRSLQIMPVMKSSMIRVRYSSDDPERSQQVLRAMARAYLNRHLELHGNAGSVQFFEQQSTEAQGHLKNAQDKLVKFQTASGVVSAAEQKELLLQKSVELRVGLHAAEAEFREVTRKAATLSERMSRVSPRISTQKRAMPNQYSIERMNTLLVELRNRRTEALSKYRPTDRTVTQLDQQIADTQKALADAEGHIASEEASDVNPVRQTIETELTRAEADAAGLRGRIAAMREQDKAYRQELTRLEKMVPLEQQFQREAKVAEDNYLLYARKQEEARIGERMDQQKIANVVLAEAPRAPVLPKGRMGTVVPAFLLALIASAAIVAVFSRFRKTVNTPWELETIAIVPVLGTVPMGRTLDVSPRVRRVS